MAGIAVLCEVQGGQIAKGSLGVLEEARAKMLDDLSVLQGKIIGLREILTEDREG